MATQTVKWSAAIWAGVIAGAVFVMLEMIMVPAFMGGSPWAPPRMIAAIVMGEGVLPTPGGPPPTFDAGVLMVAMLVHFPLSVMYAVVLAWLVRKSSLGLALTAGAGFGLALYLVNFYGFTAVFPWFANARNWVSVVAHMIFGLVAAGTYLWLAGPARAAATGTGGAETEDRGRMAAD